ncbi:hypothetical protein [Sinomonas mesophila]|uniref:hypothetical protein n=1 Tax=Sinomonas mesophila TaxID=1531955 RepID=UPI001115662C|nr:hypothetical protein [Sinomonas mesophila]
MSPRTTPLEVGYRRALRAYPRSWRARYGDEFVGVLLDIAESRQRTHPTSAELVAVVFHGLIARISLLLGMVAPAERRDRVAAAATIILTALAAIMMVLGEVGRWFRSNSYTLADGLYGPFTTAASNIYLLAMAAFGALVIGREGFRKLLLGLTVLACLATPLLTDTAHAAVAVHWFIPAVFATGSLLALIGRPARNRKLTKIVVWATPVVTVLLTLTSYLQGGGSQRTFYGHSLMPVVDALTLSRSAAEILALTTAVLLASRKLLPWVVLLSVAALSWPLGRLLIFLGGDTTTGLIGFLNPGTVSTICFLAAPLSAWAAWKRPRLEFGDGDMSALS